MRRLLLFLLAAPLLTGCVRRGIVVESEPPGAEVWMDGDLIGITPVRTPFAHYGTREVVVAKGGFARMQEMRAVDPPWYERFPLDFFTENVWPGTLVDERYFVYTLKPETVDPEGVYERGKAMREEVLKRKAAEEEKK